MIFMMMKLKQSTMETQYYNRKKVLEEETHDTARRIKVVWIWMDERYRHVIMGRQTGASFTGIRRCFVFV